MSWLRFHPFTRITIVVAIVVGAALFTGWERVGDALANISPAGTFEERCESLPRGGVKIGLEPWNVVENQSLPFATLTYQALFARLAADPGVDREYLGYLRARYFPDGADALDATRRLGGAD